MTPAAVVIALGVWWTSNTIAHLCIHRPFFRRRWANEVTAALLSIASGVPQPLWRQRHLAHHAGVTPPVRVTPVLIGHVLLIGGAWCVLLARAPAFFAGTYLPGYFGGLLLCALHGHYEHAGGTTSHYGRLYNLLMFNDGFHVEHHAHPLLPWWRLPSYRAADARFSVWPAPIRWLEPARTLAALERLVLWSPPLQRFVLRTHEHALRGLLETMPPPARVAIVGGGLYPRSALVLRRLLPAAHLTIIDADAKNLSRAHESIGDAVTFVHARFDPRAIASDFDLVVIPLAFVGNRNAIYAHPPAQAVIVHDWLWRKRGISRIVSLALCKRVNLVPAPQRVAANLENLVNPGLQ